MDDDDDNLIINVVAGEKDRNTMFKDPTLEAITAIQNSLSKESRLATDIQKEGRTMPSNKKRKAPSEVKDGEAHTLLSKAEAKQSLEFKRDSQLLNRSAKLPKKSPWKDLVSASSGAPFSVLDILLSAIHGKEMQYGSDGVSEFSSDEKDEVTNDEKMKYQAMRKEVSDQYVELDKVESEDEVSNDEKVLDQHEDLDKVESEDEVSNDEKVLDQHDELDIVKSEDEVSNDEKVSDQHEELVKVEYEEKVPDQHEELDKIATDNLDGHVDIYVRGAAWWNKTVE
ncbi:hypothetical protein H5410_023241 [Solanum commersonii]|uniref:Uncharacterized protein n=1 Tax=Solanum commersonii TaxID=4109 RepID=A0A9J5ZJ02_SOLCO|nr:hypothetical protein H5410_023241 [Solanum commersonii]